MNRYSNQQFAASYNTRANRQNTRSAYTDGSEDLVVLARLVREESRSYQYLDSSGAVVQTRSNAICARDTNSGLIWQLFSKGDSSRFKKYVDIQPLIAAQSANNICGKSNWRYPTKPELYG
ncbi:hypothetical protein AB4344_22455, partial [Vibrio breoganii]